MEQKNANVIFGLNDRPKPGIALTVAFQHLLAIFVGIITPTIVLAGIFKWDITTTGYLVSMALIVSGVSTFVQTKRLGPIGSGLLSIQGTSFAFIGPLIAAGFAGGGGEAGLAMIFGVCFFGSFIEMILSRFIHHLRKVITPIVTGTVVSLIGLSLIKVGITDMGGGAWLLNNKPEFYGSIRNFSLAMITMVAIIIFNRSKNPIIRMSSIMLGLLIGYIISIFMGLVDFSALKDIPVVSIPIPFKFGISFSFKSFLPIAIIYVITTIESTGDLTATSMVSGEPIQGKKYINRIKGGVLGDGFNSMVAAIFNTFPNTTFSQNNGVIQLTGVASRYVGMYLAGILVFLGLFPIIGGVFQIMPKPVLGGATIIMFATVAAAGIKIISTVVLTRRRMMILAVSFGLGLGVLFVPQFLSGFAPNGLIRTVFSSSITTGGLTALILNLVLPRVEPDDHIAGDIADFEAGESAQEKTEDPS